MRDLKNSECPERCPGGFMEAERTEMLLRWGGAGRAFAGLKKQRMPGTVPGRIYGSGADRNAPAVGWCREGICGT